MTIGEKIIHLRNVNKISQDDLASKMHVTRQAISKWESDESAPSIDNILELCKLFRVTADELINDKIIINKNKVERKKVAGKPKYFGTDGFRGEANGILTAKKAFKIGRFLGWYYSNPTHLNKKVPGKYHPSVVIGKDTRRSSYMLEYAIAAGFASSGANVSMLHVTTSPSVSYIVRQDKFDLGVMITASHNVFYDNGIKVINHDGEKLDDSVALLIEAYLDNNLKDAIGINRDEIPYAKKEDIGQINDYFAGRNRYIAYLISLAKYSMRTLKVGLDTANGCSYMIAKNVFEALGAEVYMINNKPNGLNVNLNAGSTHIEGLCKLVKENKLNIGFAFDGDADRCIAVDEKGNIVDGDKIMYLLAKKLVSEYALPHNTVVTTIMSNSGLSKALKKIGLNNIQTQVGDRFVYEEMKKHNYSLGGEQSGHIIIRKYATTGDGILTAIMVVEEMLRVNSELSKLVEDVKLLPQITKNVRVTSKPAAFKDEQVQKALQKEINSLTDGRILLRESGTEPVIRIMAECPTIKECNAHIEKIYEVIRKRGYVCE